MRPISLAILIVMLLSAVPSSLAHSANARPPAASEATSLRTAGPAGDGTGTLEQAATKLRRTKRGQHPPSYNPYMRDTAAFANARAAGYNGPAAPDLDQLLATGVISDPLHGNEVIGLNDQFMVLFDGQNYPTTQALNPTFGAAQGAVSGSGASPYPNGSLWQLSMSGIAADVNGDWVDDLVWVTNFGAGGQPCIGPVVTSFNLDLSVKGQQPPNPLHPTGTHCESFVDGNLFQETTRLAAGNFYDNGANRGRGQQVVMAWNNGSTLCVRVWDNQPNGTLTQNPSVCLPGPVMTYDPVYSDPNPGIFSLATGDLNNDGDDEIVVGFVEPGGIAYDIQVLTAAAGAAPVVTASLRVPRQGSIYTMYQISLALGDFDGSGSKSIAVVTQDQQHVLLYLWIVNSALNGITQGKQSPYQIANENVDPGAYWGQVAAVAAPFLAEKPGIDLLAVVWQQEAYSDGFKFYATGFLSLFDLQGQTIQTPLIREQQIGGRFATNLYAPMSAAASYPGPTIDTARLVIGAPGLTDNSTTQWVTVSVFSFTLSGNTATATGGPVYGNPSLALRQVQLNSNSGPYTVNNGVVNVIPGDFAGIAIHLELISKQEIPSLIQVMSELRAPPTHYDMFPEIGPNATVDLNVNFPHPSCQNTYYQGVCSYVRYETQTQTGTDQTIGYKRNWSVAATTEVDVPDIVNSSLTASYGQEFDKTTQKIENLSTASGIGSGQDDVLVYTETDFAIWEYAVYRRGVVVTYVAVIFPDVICTATSCQPNSFPGEAAGNSLPWYFPNTEPGNILSYPSFDPTDILTPVLPLSQTPDMVLGTSYTDLLVSSQQMNVNTQNKTVNVGIESQVDAGFDIFGAGVKITVKGDYSKSNISGQTLSFDETTSLHVNFSGLSNTPFNNPQYGNPSQWFYTVRPFIYDSTGTYLRVNYRVSIPNNATSPWTTYYGQLPDFAFIRRNRFSELNTNLSYDIRFTGVETPTVGQPLSIQSIVRNFSLLPYGGTPVAVAFYNGNPAQGGTLIGTQTFSAIPAQGFTSVEQPFTPSTSGCLQIWSVIDPHNTQKEIHKANNTGFTTLPVFAPNGSGNNPCTGSHTQTKGRQAVYRLPGGAPDLVVTNADIGYAEPPAGTISRPITLTAKISAHGAHYSNVAVMFYDGDPHSGGTLIDSDVIPLIWSGYSADASVAWTPAQPFGRHNLVVRVRPIATQEVNYDNNTAMKQIDLGRYPVLLPGVPHQVPEGALSASGSPVRRPRRRRRA